MTFLHPVSLRRCCIHAEGNTDTNTTVHKPIQKRIEVPMSELEARYDRKRNPDDVFGTSPRYVAMLPPYLLLSPVPNEPKVFQPKGCPSNPESTGSPIQASRFESYPRTSLAGSEESYSSHWNIVSKSVRARS